MPLIGNTLDLLRDASGFLVDTYQKLGPTFCVNAFGQHYTVMAGREALEFLLTVGEKHFSRDLFYVRFAQELGAREFILGAQGTRHRQLRKVMKLGFSRQVAEVRIPAMIDGVLQRAKGWTAGQSFRVPDLMADLAFDAYSLVMTGAPLHEYFQDALTYSETIMRVGAKIRPALLLSLPRYRRAKRSVFSLMERLLREHRLQPDDPSREFDLFYALLDGTQGAGHEFTDSDIIATALYGFVGTLVYLNRVLAYLLYEVLKDPRLRAQVTAEADAVLSTAHPTAQDLRRMSTLHAAYLETLRFHPIALGLPFLVEEDFEFAGRVIRRGQKVVITSLPVHFSSDFYTNPCRFDSSRCAAPRHEIDAGGAYAPFGFGGRVCAAAGLVEIISLAITAALLQVADLRLEPPDYEVKTGLDPLPGPEAKFTVCLTELRQPRIVTAAVPSVEDTLPAVLPGLTSAQWNSLLSHVETVDYETGAFIIREGDVAEHFFILVEGEVEVLKRRLPDGEQVLAVLGPGDYFGEIGLLRKVPRTASIRARSRVKTLVVDRETFVTLIAESDLVSNEIAATIRRRTMATRLAEALPHLSRDQVAQFLPNVRLQRYAAGETIVREGDPSDAFFVIVSGRVEVVRRRPSGQDVVLHEMGTGEWFGEIGILLGRPRTATVRVTSEAGAEMMVLGKSQFQALIAGSGRTEDDVWTVMRERLSTLEE